MSLRGQNSSFQPENYGDDTLYYYDDELDLDSPHEPDHLSQLFQKELSRADLSDEKRLLITALQDHGEKIFAHKKREDALLTILCRIHRIDTSSLHDVEIQDLDFEDIGLDFGTKRHVFLLTLHLNNNKTLSFTASLDKKWYDSMEESPSLRESHALATYRDELPHCPTLQNYGGALLMHSNDQMRGLILKEYLPGIMLANITYDIELAKEQLGEETVKEIAYQVGTMVAQTIGHVRGIPLDSHPLNMIIDEEADNTVSIRYCDVEEVHDSSHRLRHELRLLRREFGTFAPSFDEGFQAYSQHNKDAYPFPQDPLYREDMSEEEAKTTLLKLIDDHFLDKFEPKGQPSHYPDLTEYHVRFYSGFYPGTLIDLVRKAGIEPLKLDQQLDLGRLNQARFNRFKAGKILASPQSEFNDWRAKIYDSFWRRNLNRRLMIDDFSDGDFIIHDFLQAIDAAAYIVADEELYREFQSKRKELEALDIADCREVLERSTRILREIIKEEGVPPDNSGFFGL